tara:strand:- start:2765 stop:3640 length:876 start_codon:yes stop_codon:yes gene_type:complete
MPVRRRNTSMNFIYNIKINKTETDPNANFVDNLEDNYQHFIFQYDYNRIISIIVEVIVDNFSKSMTCKIIIDRLNMYIRYNILFDIPMMGYKHIEFDICDLLEQFLERIYKYYKYVNKVMINGIKYDSSRLIKLVFYLIQRYNNKLINTSYHIDNPIKIYDLDKKIKLQLYSDELYEMYRSYVIVSIQNKYIKLEVFSSNKSSINCALTFNYHSYRLINMVLIFKILPLEIIEQIYTNVLILESKDNVNSFIKQIRNVNKDKNKSRYNRSFRFIRHAKAEKARLALSIINN